MTWECFENMYASLVRPPGVLPDKTQLRHISSPKKQEQTAMKAPHFEHQKGTKKTPTCLAGVLLAIQNQWRRCLASRRLISLGFS